MRGKRLIVTGGAGFIGSHLTGALLSEGHKVTVIDNFSSGKKENLSEYKNDKNLTVVKASILNKKRMFELFSRVDWVYHLATVGVRVSIANPELAHRVNTQGTLNLCQAALKNKVKRFIYVSSSEAYGSAVRVPMTEEHPFEPTTVYGASKAAGELYSKAFLRVYGLPVIIIRPFNTYGPKSHFEGAYGEVIPKFVIRALNNNPPVIFGEGSQTRDFTYITDTVRGIILASKAEALIGKAVNIAYGKEVSIERIAHLVLSAVGSRDIKVLKGRNRPGDVDRHYADISLAKKVLNYTPEVSIEDGIERYVGWIRKSGFDFKSLLKEEKLYNW